MIPDRWIAHDPKRCGADEMPEGYICKCGRFWPRPAAFWNGEFAIGKRNVEKLMEKYRKDEGKGDET